MAWNYYFKDRTGAQNGPVSLEELTAIARAGRIAPDCLVWPEGGAPRSAREMPELAGVMGGGPAGVVASTTLGAGAGPLAADFPVWGLFWRSLVAGLGFCFILPAPWAALWLYRWLATRVALPNGVRLRLESDFGAPALLFIGLALTVLAPALYVLAVSGGDPAAARGPDVALVRLFGNVAEILLSWLILRWWIGSMRSEDGALNIGFAGGFWGFLGWNLLVGLSIISIIGWAWVARLMIRWICRNIVGSHVFDFNGLGLEILWRTLATVIGCMFVIPIPWLVAWYYNWLVGQFVAAPAQAEPALAQAVAA